MILSCPERRLHWPPVLVEVCSQSLRIPYPTNYLHGLNLPRQIPGSSLLPRASIKKKFSHNFHSKPKIIFRHYCRFMVLVYSLLHELRSYKVIAYTYILMHFFLTFSLSNITKLSTTKLFLFNALLPVLLKLVFSFFQTKR